MLHCAALQDALAVILDPTAPAHTSALYVRVALTVDMTSHPLLALWLHTFLNNLLIDTTVLATFRQIILMCSHHVRRPSNLTPSLFNPKVSFSNWDYCVDSPYVELDDFGLSDPNTSICPPESMTCFIRRLGDWSGVLADL